MREKRKAGEAIESKESPKRDKGEEMVSSSFSPTTVMPVIRKLSGFEFWRKTLHSARHILAPMVDQSELAWRMLARRHGAHLAYTPMINARIFEVNQVYRSLNWEPCSEDRPLVAQLCGDEVACILRVAKMLEEHCDAIDLNLGCPQNIARKGHYGAFLQDEWDLIRDIVSKMHTELKVPVTVKIRVFPDVSKTVAYAKMLEEAGAQLITVHGRTREQKGPHAGLADWSQIKAVVEAVRIPVIANGNILSLNNLEACIKETGAVGVMSAEGHLYNPYIFEGCQANIVEVVKEYLELIDEHPTNLSWIRGHLFKLYRPCLMLPKYLPFRHSLGIAKNLEALKELCLEINKMLQEDEAGMKEGMSEHHWICTPYIRHPGSKRVDPSSLLTTIASEPSAGETIIMVSEINSI